MKSILFIQVALFPISMMAQQPNMQVWTDAWRSADPILFRAVYTENAQIFPPNKPTIRGSQSILEFMQGGLGKVDVLFTPDHQIVADRLAFEYGIFEDLEFDSGKLLGQGHYSVTWILEDETWKVLCHTWTMPTKGK